MAKRFPGLVMVRGPGHGQQLQDTLIEVRELLVYLMTREGVSWYR